MALHEELLVVVEHVQAAFKVAEHDGHGLNPLLVGQVLQALFLKFVHRNPLGALFFGFQVELFELSVGQAEKIRQMRHMSP
jgi:hypothetical protein